MTHKLDFSLVFLNICFIKNLVKTQEHGNLKASSDFLNPIMVMVTAHFQTYFAVMLIWNELYLVKTMASNPLWSCIFYQFYNNFTEQIMDVTLWRKSHEFTTVKKYDDFIKVLATNMKTNMQKRDFCSTKFYVTISAMVYIFEN